MKKKLISISGEDWMKGISLQPTIAVGGIFQLASNFDPFYRMGFMQPSFAATRYGTSEVTKTIRYMTGMDISGPFLIGYADNGSATALYKINATTGAVTDEIASITTATNARGLLFGQNRLLYAGTTTIRSVSAALGGDASVLTGLTDGEHPMVVGADLNIYGINGGADANQIFRIVDASSTTGNVTNAFALEAGMRIRDLKNDGRYLVIIADNRNSSSSGIGTYNCVIAYWDYFSGTLTQRYDFRDSAMNALAIQDDGSAIVFGSDNIYVCNVASFPRPILSFKVLSNIATPPTSPAQVIKRNGSILWGGGDDNIFGYGSLIAGQKKIFFSPYSIPTGTVTALAENTGQVWAANSTPAFYGFWDGSRDTAVVYTTHVSFDRPYRLSDIKIVARGELASGESITVQVVAEAGGSAPSVTQTFSYATDGAKKVRIFPPKPNTDTSVIVHEIFKVEITANTAVQTIEIFGEEVDPLDQSI